MKYTRWLLRWLTFAAVIVGIGAAVYSFVRSRPRVSIHVHGDVAAVAPDGSKFLTSLTHPSRGGKLQVWDAHDGRLLHEWTSDRDSRFAAWSTDERHYASYLEDSGPLRLFDWQAGKQWTFDAPNHVNSLEFSPTGRWLFAMTAMGDPNYLIDVQSRKIVLRTKDLWPRFSADDRYLFDRKGKCCALTIWDLEANKAVGEVPLTSAHYRISQDASLLVEKHHEPTPEPDLKKVTVLDLAGGGVQRLDPKNYRIDVWDVAARKHRFHHKLPTAGDLQIALSPDGRRLAVWLRGKTQKSDLEMLDTASGKVLWRFPMHLAGECVISPDSSLVYLVHHVEGKFSVVNMFDIDSGKPLWRRLGWGATHFVKDTNVIWHQDESGKPFMLLDARAGEQLGRIPQGFVTHSAPAFTPDATRFVLPGWRIRERPAYFWEAWLDEHWPALFNINAPAVLVADAHTGGELFHGVNCGKTSALLASDGNTLVTTEQLSDDTKLALMRVWEVHSTKAWTWAIGVALATAVVWLLGATLWQRRRKDIAAAKST